MEYLDDGRFRIDLDDGTDPITVARPKYGTYKRLRLMAVEMGRDATEKLNKARDLEDGSEEQIAAMQALDEDATLELERFWRATVDALGDRGLPEDVDEWPLDLIVRQSAVSATLEHWRTRPLARGDMGNPIPSAAT